MKINPALVVAPASAAALTLGYAYYEAHNYTLREEALPILPHGAAAVTILHITDLHLRPRQQDKIEWVRNLAALEPDFVIDTGDNLGHLQAVPALTHALEPLLDIPGAFVMGSNDYYGPRLKNPLRYLRSDSRLHHLPPPPSLPHQELTRYLADKGWLDLTNTRASVDIRGNRIDFVGVDDPHLDLDVYPSPQKPSATHATRIGVLHAPYTRVLDQMHEDDCAAIIAGHTHGGQLCVPGFGALVTNCDLDRSRASGLHGWPENRPDEEDGENSVWLQVGAGVGSSPHFPFRIACKPEATLLTLTEASI